MAKLAPKQVKQKVVNLPLKNPGSTRLPSGYSTGVKIGVKPVKQTVVKIPSSYRGGNPGQSINFGLPSFGGGGGGVALPSQQNNQLFLPINPFNSQEVVQYNKDHHIGDKEGILNPFQAVNDLATKLGDPSTWFQVVGFVIAVILILSSLYGIVSSGQKSLVQSTLGTNVSSVVNAVKPKVKNGKK